MIPNWFNYITMITKTFKSGGTREMLALSLSHSLHPPPHPLPNSFPKKRPFSTHGFTTLNPPKTVILSISASDPTQISVPAPSSDDPNQNSEPEPDSGDDDGGDGFELEVEKAGKRNRRVIRSRIRVDADLESVWSVLTDYEGLADFIPGLAVSELVEKKEKFARLYQVGKQDLALGLKFDAKGVLDCYEGDLECFPSGRRRDIEFKMVEGDFQLFEGRWSIEQIDKGNYQGGEFLIGQDFQTTLLYTVEVEPKLWLPVRLLEGRLCREVKKNLRCIKDEAQRLQRAEKLTSTWETGEK